MIAEIARTSPLRLLVMLGGPEFDNFCGGENFMRILFSLSS
jgi:hypothetical protein